MTRSPYRSKAQESLKGIVRDSNAKVDVLGLPDTPETDQDETPENSNSSLLTPPDLPYYNKRQQNDDCSACSDLTEPNEQSKGNSSADHAKQPRTAASSAYLPKNLSSSAAANGSHDNAQKPNTTVVTASPTRRRQSLLGMMGKQADGMGSTRRFSMASAGPELGTSSSSLHYDSSNHGDDASDGGIAEPDFEIVMSVVNSWEVVKTIDGYEETIAEQILLRMMELDGTVRKDLNLMSIRSPRFDVIKEKIMSVLDGLISFLGPDLEDFFDEIEEVGRRYRADGFKEFLLTPAVVEAVRYILPEEEFPWAIESGWKTVMNFLVFKM